MDQSKINFFGIAIEVLDNLPANSFMMVSRVSENPATFHVLMMAGGGEIKEWRGTVSEAVAARG